MKTKEIEVWVSHNDVNKISPGCTDSLTVYTKNCFNPSIKARLIIELPEKKVEISESQITEFIDELEDRNNTLTKRQCLEVEKLLKLKLFGKEEM